ncbi:MAG: cytochrome c oxidase subunit II [Pirellulaceae bacterium]
MGRFWSLLFLLVPILGVGLFVVAALPNSAPLYNHWFPEDVSRDGYVIDNLFNFILYLTGVIFVVTGFLMFWFLWKYDAAKNPEPVKFIHGSHSLEIVWSILPAVTLLFIAIYQMDAWAAAKMRRPVISAGADGVEGTSDDLLKPPLVEITGRQFEWRLRYAGADQKIGTPDDVHGVNELHIPVDEDIVVALKSQDVLHSFFLPNLRLKQDIVPGMKQFLWFRATRSGTYDIVCAELCGWGHYKMRGRLVIESREDFDRWLQAEQDEQNRVQYSPSETDDE